MKKCTSKNSIAFIGMLITLIAFGAKKSFAHHGGVSAAFGPGAPVETTAPLTLPEGMWLLFNRYEVADYKPYQDHRGNYSGTESQNIDRFTFNSTMIGYGLRDDLSVYVVLPYAEKKQDNVGASRGFGDILLLLQYGFKYGTRNGIRGWYAYGKEDTVGKDYTISDYKFTVFGGLSIPTGTINNRGNDLDGDGVADKLNLGLQPGFAGPSYNIGIAGSKLLINHLTFTADTSIRAFAQTNDGRPGNEVRANAALGYEVYEQKKGFLTRVDLIGEANFLHLDKDQDEDRFADDATGGAILYLSPAMRLTFLQKISVGLMVKFPTWTNLNKGNDQQGAEGVERYRAIATVSVSF